MGRLRIVRQAWLALLASLHLCACGLAAEPEGQHPYRMLSGLDLRVFGCSPNPGYQRFASRAELLEALDGMAAHCREPGYTELRQGFLRSLEDASARFDEESLLVLAEYYGTGMAKARLELGFVEPDVVRAAIVWELPPPPHTPDTVVYRFAFAVDESAVGRVVVTGRRAEETVIPISR